MMWETLPACGRCPPLRRSSRGSSSPGSLSASSRAMSQTRTEPRLLPDHSSPQGVRHSAVTDPTLWACQTPTHLLVVAQTHDGTHLLGKPLLATNTPLTEGSIYLKCALLCATSFQSQQEYKCWCHLHWHLYT